MARCNECNKFVSFDFGADPELSAEVGNPEDFETPAGEEPAKRQPGETDTLMVELEARLMLTCDQCGTELREYNYQETHEISVPAVPPSGEWDGDWEVEAEVDEGLEERGKGKKKVYACTVDIVATREHTDTAGETKTVTVTESGIEVGAAPGEWEEL